VTSSSTLHHIYINATQSLPNFNSDIKPYTREERETMRMRLITRLTRSPVRSKVAATAAPVVKAKEAAYGNGTAWVGFVTTAAALGVAMLMSKDAPSSDVACGSSGGDSWWASPKLEQRGHYALLKELGRGGSKDT
jgi:hypothetical protein